MKILVYEYNGFTMEEYVQVLSSLGHEVIVITNFEENTNILSESLENKFIKTLVEFKPDFIFSINFFKVISCICERENIKYVSWIVDNPLNDLYSSLAFNKCNYIFLFDESQYNEFKNRGLTHVYYLPLCVNTNRLDLINISQEDISKYSSDVSFVGRLYNNNRFDNIKRLTPYIKGYVDGLIRAQANVVGYNFTERSLNPYFIEQFVKYAKYSLADDIDIPVEKLIAHEFIDRKCNQFDRIRTLNVISEICKLTIFSSDNLDIIPKAVSGGMVSYLDEMPKVFKLSKINLNPTSKSIITGIPLRAFDIMGAGGFLLTSYQLELEKYFEFDKDLVVYYSLEDLKDKILYYLEHENERKDIAYNGYIKVKEQHNMLDKLNYIIKTVAERDLL